jgi:adenosylcobinamide-GDP ribazoletransferase
MGEPAASQLSKTAVWMVTAVVLIFSLVLFNSASLIYISAMLIIFIIGYLLRRMMLQRIDGTTGDTAGALVELIETSTLLVFILLTSF